MSEERVTPSTLTVERLRALLAYDPSSGAFTWTLRTSNRINVGGVAGTIHPYGYRIIKVDGRLYKAHRLAWFHVHGRWPLKQIDHVNGDRADNRIGNLREATNAENHQNLGRRSDNVSGRMGVSWHKAGQRWQATIKRDGIAEFLGLFDDIEEASKAYIAAKRRTHTFQPEVRHE